MSLQRLVSFAVECLLFLSIFPIDIPFKLLSLIDTVIPLLQTGNPPLFFLKPFSGEVKYN